MTEITVSQVQESTDKKLSKERHILSVYPIIYLQYRHTDRRRRPTWTASSNIEPAQICRQQGRQPTQE